MKILINFLLVLFLINCTGMKEVHNTEYEIKITDLNAWLNLMPGGPGSFHLSGEFNLFTDQDNFISEVQLKEVSVFSKDELLYNFKPITQYSRAEPDYSTNNRKIEVYQFYMESGLEIQEVLMSDNIISVEFVFNVDDVLTQVVKENVEVSRAY